MSTSVIDIFSLISNGVYVIFILTYDFLSAQIGIIGYPEKLEEIHETEVLAVVEDVDSRQAFAQCGQHWRRIKGKYFKIGKQTFTAIITRSVRYLYTLFGGFVKYFFDHEQCWTLSGNVFTNKNNHINAHDFICDILMKSD